MRWWQIRKRDADLERELQSDLELEEEEQRERGLSAEEARYAARRAFGNTTLIGLCPEKRVSGGKVLSCRTRRVAHRAATALRLGAHALSRAKGYFGEFFRRMRSKLGTASAITATAHKIARVIYHVLLTKEPYRETVFHQCEEQSRERAQLRLRRYAHHLGFQLRPIASSDQ